MKQTNINVWEYFLVLNIFKLTLNLILIFIITFIKLTIKLNITIIICYSI